MLTIFQITCLFFFTSLVKLHYQHRGDILMSILTPVILVNPLLEFIGAKSLLSMLKISVTSSMNIFLLSLRNCMVECCDPGCQAHLQLLDSAILVRHMSPQGKKFSSSHSRVEFPCSLAEALCNSLAQHLVRVWLPLFTRMRRRGISTKFADSRGSRSILLKKN